MKRQHTKQPLFLPALQPNTQRETLMMLAGETQMFFPDVSDHHDKKHNYPHQMVSE